MHAGKSRKRIDDQAVPIILAVLLAVSLCIASLLGSGCTLSTNSPEIIGDDTSAIDNSEVPNMEIIFVMKWLGTQIDIHPMP